MLDFLVYFAMAALYVIIISEMFCMAIVEVKTGYSNKRKEVRDGLRENEFNFCNSIGDNMTDYYNKHFSASATANGDTVSVSKGGGSNWVNLSMQYNPDCLPVEFDLRNRQIVEHLHFMLGQFLRETT